MALKANCATLAKQWYQIKADAAIRCGDEIGPSGASWQDVAGTMACNMRVYARLLDRLRNGDEAPDSFPSWAGEGELGNCTS